MKKLKEEIKTWVDEGIISSEQKEKIISRYKVIEKTEDNAGTSKLTLISVMGSVLVGIGFILFIFSN